MRAPLMAPKQSSEIDDTIKRPPIIKQEVLKTMDNLDSGDGGWASACGEVDYK